MAAQVPTGETFFSRMDALGLNPGLPAFSAGVMPPHHVPLNIIAQYHNTHRCFTISILSAGGEDIGICQELQFDGAGGGVKMNILAGVALVSSGRVQVNAVLIVTIIVAITARENVGEDDDDDDGRKQSTKDASNRQTRQARNQTTNPPSGFAARSGDFL